jgi:1-acyl-sn-glycerol-3-phosphate acyltransferase
VADGGAPRKPAARKATARKTTARKTAVKKTTASNPAATKTTAKKTAAAKKTAEAEPAARKGPAKRGAAAGARNTAAKQASPETTGERRSTAQFDVEGVLAELEQLGKEVTAAERAADLVDGGAALRANRERSAAGTTAAPGAPTGTAAEANGRAAEAGGTADGRAAGADGRTPEPGRAAVPSGTSPEFEADAETGPRADRWERRVAGGLAFLRRRLTGEYEIDEFGFDRDLTENVLAAPFRPLYEKYWRVEVTGLENVPSDGSALVVGNHSGTMAALDAVMVQLALLDRHPAKRHLRMLGADLVFSTPFVGELARKSGSTLACNADAERLLCDGHVVGVWPEGFKGIGKPFSDRYKLQRFGRGGFVSAALKTGAPIVPVSIVGAEEIYPMLGNAKTLARVLGLPYFPLTPTFPWLGPLGLVPLPSKWLIEFGEPIETAQLADHADDPMLVFNLTDQVRETIQQTLYRLLLRRSSVFS